MITFFVGVAFGALVAAGGIGYVVRARASVADEVIAMLRK